MTNHTEQAESIIRDLNKGHCGEHIRTRHVGRDKFEVEFVANSNNRQTHVVVFDGTSIEYRLETPYTYMRRVTVQG